MPRYIHDTAAWRMKRLHIALIRLIREVIRSVLPDAKKGGKP